MNILAIGAHPDDIEFGQVFVTQTPIFSHLS